MQPNQFRYTLIVRGVKKYVLKIAPIGHDKNIIKYTRNDTYFGLIRNLTVPLEFVKVGADIIRKEWYKYRVKADVVLLLEKRTDAWGYDTVYTGPLDFSTIQDKDNSVIINALSSGLAENVKAYGNADFTIPVAGDKMRTITLPSLKLWESASLIFKQDTAPNPGNYFPGLTVASVQAASNQSSTKDVDYSIVNAPDFGTIGTYFYHAQLPNTATITGTLDFNINRGGANRIVDVSLYDSASVKRYTAFRSGSITGTVHIDLNCTVPVIDQMELFWYITLEGSGSSFTSVYILQGQFDIKYLTVSPPTPCNVVPVSYLFQQLLNNMNGVPTLYQSRLLDVTWKNLYITCGDAIRQLTKRQITNADGSITEVAATPAIKSSFEDFFQSVNAVCNAAFSVSGTTGVLEAKSSAYQRGVRAATVERAINVVFSQVKEMLYNTIKAGYAPQTYDQTNGRDEFNSEVNWKTPISKVAESSKELDLQCRYRADMYGIEYTRINLSDKQTVDSDSDNDTFLIYLNDDLTAPQQAPAFVSGSTAANTIYNWFISPKRNLLRHGDYLHSLFFGLDAYSIQFTSADKNVDLITTDDSGMSVSEKADIAISTLAPALFQPIQATFTCDFHTLAYLDSAPGGYIEFPRNGKLYKGFMEDAGVDISDNAAQDYTLILTADNIL